MNKLWSLFKIGLLSSVLVIALNSCGRTGADPQKIVEVPMGNSNTPSSSMSTSSAVAVSSSSSAISSADSSAGDLVVAMDDATIVEGTPALDGNIILPGGTDPIASLKFKLNKPLSADAKITAVVDFDNTDCAPSMNEGYSVPHPQVEPVIVKQGSQQLSINATVWRDTNPEDDCHSAFALNIEYADHTDLIKASGSLLIKDDDLVSGNLWQPESERNVHFGDVITYDLNGSHKADDAKYQVTQVFGPTAEFKIIEDKLRILMPVVPADKLDNTKLAVIRFRVTPENAATFELQYFAHSSLPGTSGIDRGDSELTDVVFKNIISHGYLSEYLIADDLSKLSWTIETTGADNVITLDQSNLSLYKGSSQLQVKINPEDKKLIRQGIELDADNRTIRIKPEAIPIYQKYIDDSDIFTIKAWATTRSTDKLDSEVADPQPIVDSAVFDLNIRPAKRKLEVKVLNSDGAAPLSGDYQLVLQEVVPHTIDLTVRILPVVGNVTTFENLYQGQYIVKLIDLTGTYESFDMITINPSDTIKTITVTPKKNTTLSSPTSAGTTIKKLETGTPLKLAKQTLRQQKEDLGSCVVYNAGTDNVGIEVRTREQDKKISCEHEFTEAEMGFTDDVDPKQKQFVVEVESLEWPYLQNKDAKLYNDTWHFVLNSSGLSQINLTNSGTVKESNASSQKRIYESACFTPKKDPKSEGPVVVTFSGDVTGVGDNQLNTYVRAWIVPCANLFSIRDAKIENRGDTSIFKGKPDALTDKKVRDLKFAHSNVTKNGNHKIPVMSLPIELNTPAYNSEKNAFSFKFNLIPLSAKDNVESIKLDEIKLQLIADDGPQVIDLGVINSTSKSNPIVEISNLQEKLNGVLVTTGKTIKITDYRLPQKDSNNSPINYSTDMNTFKLLVSATLKIGAASYDAATEELKFDDSEVGIEKEAKFIPLLDLTALNIKNPSRLTSWDLRFSTREDEIGRDGWIVPAIWNNLFKAPLVGDSEFLSKLSINDVSAVHVHCYVLPIIVNGKETYDQTINGKCRSLLGHWAHQGGYAMDIKYLNEKGETNTGGMGTGLVGFSAVWLAAKTDTTNASRKKLRSWILKNREFIEQIASQVASSDSPLKKVILGTTGNPSMCDILTKKNTFPGTDFVGADDDSLGAWDFPEGVTVQCLEPHDDHSHLEFEVPVLSY